MVRIYGTDDCWFCKEAAKVAESYDLRYTYINVKENEETVAEFKSLFPEAKTVPQIVWYNRHIGGYDDFLKEIEDTRNYGDGQV